MKILISPFLLITYLFVSGFPINNIAEAMGHTQEVHLQNYGRFKPSGTTDLYSNRNKQVS